MNIDKINVGGNLYDVCDTNARAMISDEYNSATQYSAGDYCIWENTLKKANKSTTGTYDHTAWDDTNIGEVVGELNQNMNIIEVSARTEQDTDMQPGAIGYLTLTFNVPEGYKINNIKSYSIGSWDGMLLQGYSISGNSINFSIYNANPAVHPASIAAIVNCSKIN